MLKVVTAKEMQEIDRLTIEKYGVAGTILMERAGTAVAKKINELFTVHSLSAGKAGSQFTENPPIPPLLKGGVKGDLD